MNNRSLRVAVAQYPTQKTKTETLALLERVSKEAAAKDVALLLFPEAFLGGYPRNADFGTIIGQRKDYGREQFLQYHNEAIDLGDTPAGAGKDWIKRSLPVQDGKEFRGDGTREELEKVAAETGVFLCVGLVERAGNTLYCSLVSVCPENGVVSKRRKVMPTGAERLVWSQGSTDTLKAINVKVKGINVTLGGAICWENYMPLLRYSLYSQNVNIWLAPTADGRDTWESLMKTIASEGRCFVLSCNQVTQQKHLPKWTASSQHETQTHSKYSAHIKSQPNGTTRARKASIIRKTESGHEICWPETPAQVTPNPDDFVPLGRRKSTVIKTTEGVELCLPALPDSESHPNGVSKDTEDIAPDEVVEVSTKQSKETKAAKTILEEKSHSNPDEESFVSRGGSCITSPMGVTIQGPVWEKEELLIADLDLDDCIRGKLDFDVAGHYSRSDSFKLEVKGLELSPPPQ